MNVDAATWMSAGGGQVADLADTRRVIKDAVDQFLNAWLTMNPKQR